MALQSSCGPGALPWIQRLFGDCIYNARDLLGFSVGMASIGCWMVAQLPQLVRNYRSKSAEALSPWFLAEWLLGDTFNLVGALLKGDQLPTVVFTAQYFICMDAVMLLQFIYYTSLQRRRERMLAARRHRRHHHHHRQRQRHQQQQQQHGHGSGDEFEPLASGSGREGWGPGAAGDAALAHDLDGAGPSGSGGSDPAVVVVDGPARSRTVPVVSAAGPRDASFRPQRVLAGLGTLLLLAQLAQRPVALEPAGEQLVAHAHRSLLDAALGKLPPHWAYTAGTVLGYCSSLLYLTSRLSQILKNQRRGTAEGLAISMFLCAAAANSLYGASILIRSYTWAELRSSLPWLIGSLGTVALDAAIFVQWRVLGHGGGADGSGVPKHHPSDEDEPLLLPC